MARWGGIQVERDVLTWVRSGEQHESENNLRVMEGGALAETCWLLQERKRRSERMSTNLVQHRECRRASLVAFKETCHLQTNHGAKGQIEGLIKNDNFGKAWCLWSIFPCSRRHATCFLWITT